MIIGVYGHPDAGKTSLVERLIGSLVKKGYTVSSVKHTPHPEGGGREGSASKRDRAYQSKAAEADKAYRDGSGVREGPGGTAGSRLHEMRS